MTQPKFALCVSAVEALNAHPLNWDTFLVDRAICDNKQNVDTANLQILPYISLVRDGGEEAKNENPKSAYVLAYDRGSKSDETRLAALSSIGFGGHIEKEVTTSIFNLVAEEGLRELYEELKYVPDTKKFYRAVTTAMIANNLIYMPETDVGSVHLGIHIPILYEGSTSIEELVAEAGHIENLRWVEVNTLTDEEIEKYEPWSGIILKRVKASLAQQAEEELRQESGEEENERQERALAETLLEKYTATQAASSDVSFDDDELAKIKRP